MIEIGGFDILQGIMLLVLFSILIVIAVLGVYLYASAMHPKRKFLVYSPTGIWVRNFRLYENKYPTEEPLIKLLLGFKSLGFNKNLFTETYLNGEPCYLAQRVSGRIFPLPLLDKLGYVDVYVKQCVKCEKLALENESRCECGGKMEFASRKYPAAEIHALKFYPNVEKNAIYKMDINGSKIPINEWLEMYDIGQKIAVEMDRSEREAKDLAEKNNPFITAIIATLPFGIILAGTAILFYLMFLGIGGEMKQAAELLVKAAELLKGAKGA